MASMMEKIGDKVHGNKDEQQQQHQYSAAGPQGHGTGGLGSDQHGYKGLGTGKDQHGYQGTGTGTGTDQHGYNAGAVGGGHDSQGAGFGSHTGATTGAVGTGEKKEGVMDKIKKKTHRNKGERKAGEGSSSSDSD
uniref:Dehydrin-like protein n=1 Tax=Selaginella lepidophylla TaxID=59777 RepID=O04283_SELLP|nr:dehydrin-like protein [Selaginella lepidophylla]